MVWRSDKADFPPFKHTLSAMIADCVEKYGDNEFLVGDGKRLTYRQAERESARLAKGLAAAGIGKGARVGLIMANTPDWVAAYFAAARAGALTLAFSTLFQARELGWALKKGDVDTLLICARYLNNDYIERLERAVPELAVQTSPHLVLKSHPYLRRIVVWGFDAKESTRPWMMRGPDDLLALAEANTRFDDAWLAAAEDNIEPADDLIGICTSGSTAEPKIVIHTHGGPLRLCYTYRKYLAFRPDERNYVAMPLFWVGGHNFNLLPLMFEGACLVFSPSPRPDDVLDTMIKEKVTRTRLWPPQRAPLLERIAERGIDMRHVDGVHNAVPYDSNGKVPPPERSFTTILGMTESFGMHSAGRYAETLPEGKGRSWGYELQGAERKIVDTNTGEDIPPGGEGQGRLGELHIRGFAMMRGYYKREWRDVFTSDGWFPTGDLCSIDAEGYLWFSGRVTEMIKTGGANVSPLEVEVLMREYPEISEAIVMGFPDPVRGEKVVGIVVLREGQTLDPAKLQARMRDDISAYKVPQQFIAMTHEDIPRTEATKPRRGMLKEMLIKQGRVS